MSNLILQPEFGYVLIVAALLGLELILIGFIFPGMVRKKHFSKEFMTSKFGEEHMRALGKEIGEGGMPDMGSGIYSRELSYEAWFDFNNGQRVHHNLVERIAPYLVFLIVAGIYLPVPAAAFGLLMMIGRIVYSVGYYMGGPAGRIIGVLIDTIAAVALLVMALMSSIYLIQNRSEI